MNKKIFTELLDVFTDPTPNHRHRKRPRKYGNFTQRIKAPQKKEDATTPRRRNDLQDIFNTAIDIANEKQQHTR